MLGETADCGDGDRNPCALHPEGICCIIEHGFMLFVLEVDSCCLECDLQDKFGGRPYCLLLTPCLRWLGLALTSASQSGSGCICAYVVSYDAAVPGGREGSDML